MNKRVLVAGGAGFIGSHLVDRLIEGGDDVVIADNFLTGRFVNLAHVDGHPRLTIVHQDLGAPLADRVFDTPFDRVYNLASPASPLGYGRYPIQTQLVNSYGAINSLELARRHGARFLQASTSEVYGDPLIHPQTEDYWGNVNPNGPRSCYDEGKRFAESVAMEFTRQYRLDVRIARIFNTYGPRSSPVDGRVVPNFCVQALRGEAITIYGDGSQTRSFCYVDDLVGGLIKLMETEGLGEVVNLGNPQEITVARLAELVIEAARSTSSIRFLPLPVDDPTRRCPDIGKATRLLGWQPRVDLRLGLGETLNSLAETQSVNLAVPTPRSYAPPRVAMG